MLLYSINTEIAFRIQRTYYNNKHYVWCTNRYNHGISQPASSNPMSIATSFLRDIISRDNHSAIIKQNRDGLKRGAMLKRQSHIITEEQEAEIITLVNQADFDQFLPLLYVIPFEGVKTICEEVDSGRKAASHSVEYIIQELPRSSFEIVEIGKTVPIEIGVDLI